MSVNTWIIVAGDPAIGTLIDTARSLGGSVSVAVVGPREVADTVAAAGVDKVVWFDTAGSVPAEAYATAVADAVAAAAPSLLLAANRASDRVLLGAAAARLQAPVLTGIKSVATDGDAVVVTCSIFGGIAEETVSVTGPLALLLEGGPVPAASTAVAVDEVTATPLGITVVETKPSSFEQVDLGAASRVVGIGRGLTQELHDDIETFERVMDDEVLGLDRGEAIAAVIANAFGKARGIGFKLKVVARVEDEFLGLVETEQPFDGE